MPSTTQRQHDFMKKAAEDPEFAKSRNIDPKVAKKFVEEDKGIWEDDPDLEHRNPDPNYLEW